MRRRFILPLIVLGIVGAIVLAVVLRLREPTLRTLVFGADGPPTLLLLHGYGSSAARWEPFTRTVWLPPGGRYVFPDAPEVTVPPDGPADGRAWWKIELAAHIPPGRTVPDLSATSPPGLRSAAALVHELVAKMPSGTIVLGGFSQGAMVASEVTFMSDARVDALVLLSGTIVDEARWTDRFPTRRGLPVFVSHGKNDTVLPFEVSDRLRTKLQAAGLAVTWFPFDGGHDIPATVVGALNEFLRNVLATGWGGH